MRFLKYQSVSFSLSLPPSSFSLSLYLLLFVRRQTCMHKYVIVHMFVYFWWAGSSALEHFLQTEVVVQEEGESSETFGIK